MDWLRLVEVTWPLIVFALVGYANLIRMLVGLQGGLAHIHEAFAEHKEQMDAELQKIEARAGEEARRLELRIADMERNVTTVREAQIRTDAAAHLAAAARKGPGGARS